MANRSYLCLSQAKNLQEVFVPLRLAPIEVSDDLLGDCPYQVPLLWLAMFRAEDLQEAQMGEEKDSIYAPITSIPEAYSQLKNSLPYLDGLFSAEGKLSVYADYFLSKLNSSGFSFVYLNLAELEMLDEPVRFRNHLYQCLLGFSRPEAVVYQRPGGWLAKVFCGEPDGNPHREALLSMTGLDRSRPILRFPGDFPLEDKKNPPSDLFSDWIGKNIKMRPGPYDPGFQPCLSGDMSLKNCSLRRTTGQLKPHDNFIARRQG